MTSEEKDLLDQIRSEGADLKSREKALQRLGEILEETFILDLLPDKAVIQALEKMATTKATPASLKRKAKSLVKAYKI
jgi:vacuolar-type H+-ATPase subunit E/Vma4